MFFILLCTIFSQKKLPKSDSLVFVKFSGKIAKSARLLSVSFTKKYNYRINADDNCTFALLIFRLHRGTCLRPMPITHLCFALWWWNSYLVLATSLAFIPSPCYRYTNRVATIGVTHTAPVWLGLALFINTTFWVGLKRGLVICELRAAKWRTGNMRTNMRTRPLIGRDVTRAPHAVRKVPHGVHSSHCFVSRPNEPYCSIAESHCICIFMTTVFAQLFVSVS